MKWLKPGVLRRINRCREGSVADPVYMAVINLLERLYGLIIFP
jgi:hypothetical protein